ncbi:S8 family peptidase [Roseateles sp.]|uniref:S8 family peptidase n=1 Tax=Roseateles sp. TaxID=1971397 RepID=UPI003BA700A6
MRPEFQRNKQAGRPTGRARFALRLLALAVCSAGMSVAQAGISVAEADQLQGRLLNGAQPSTDRLIIKYRDGSVSVQQGSQQVLQSRAIGAEMMQERMGRLEQRAARNGLQLKLLRQTGVGAHVMKLDRHLPVAQLEQLAAQMKAEDSNIEYAEPDRKMYALLTPNDSMYNQQWDLFEATGGIRAPAAWDLATGSGVVVAVLDTGIRPHADLSGQTVAGYDMINDVATANDGNARDADPSDPGDWSTASQCAPGEPARSSSWHGTHVAGTIAAKTNNGSGIAGIAYNAKIQAVRVLGRCGGYTSDIADGITWASGGSVPGLPANATPAKVLNLSLGGGGACDSTSQAAINGARARGSVIVVAAGNSNANAANFNPASCSGVVTVAATDRYGARAPYSNFGSVVSLAAPGGNTAGSSSNGILSTLNAGSQGPGADNYSFYQGTSMAAPHVAGVAALMFSVKPNATPDQIANALKSSARAFPGTCSQCGTGLLDAQAAVVAIGGGTTVPTVDEVEPNNSMAQANVVSAPRTVRAVLGNSSDTDYFRISLPAGRTLTVNLPMPNASTDYDLTLRNSAGTSLAVSEKDRGLTDSISYRNTGTTAQTLFVQVRFYAGSSNLVYSLGLSW